MPGIGSIAWLEVRVSYLVIGNVCNDLLAKDRRDRQEQFLLCQELNAGLLLLVPPIYVHHNL